MTLQFILKYLSILVLFHVMSSHHTVQLWPAPWTAPPGWAHLSAWASSSWQTSYFCLCFWEAGTSQQQKKAFILPPATFKRRVMALTGLTNTEDWGEAMNFAVISIFLLLQRADGPLTSILWACLTYHRRDGVCNTESQAKFGQPRHGGCTKHISP